MTVEAHRISIRPVEMDDGPAIQRWASDPLIAETTTLPRPYPADGGEQWARACVEARKAGTRYPFAVLLDGELVGLFGVNAVDLTQGTAYLDYWIAVPYWGQGIATNAGRLVVAWAFDKLGLRELRSSCLARNVPSGRVLEKIGFSEIDGSTSKDGEPMRRFRLRRPSMTLVWPTRDYLPGYVDALERGWSPDNLRGARVARGQLAEIAKDADAFLARLVDREGAGAPITLPDGSVVPRLPGYQRWLWDGEFCGSIGFRWQPGTEALPPYCLGHIGYSVVPWKKRRGYATQAVREVLHDAKAQGLRYVEITTRPDNLASRRVIEANGGVLYEEFVTPAAVGGHVEVRYRVAVLGEPVREHEKAPRDLKRDS
jgi:RimJ/RimL family protein N-acetyltransferase